MVIVVVILAIDGGVWIRMVVVEMIRSCWIMDIFCIKWGERFFSRLDVEYER